MAKDLRKFVQSFNMSRKFTDDCQQYESLTPVTSNCDSGLLDDHRRKRRSDWSEYLDPEEYGSKENVRPEDEGGNHWMDPLKYDQFNQWVILIGILIQHPAKMFNIKVAWFI